MFTHETGHIFFACDEYEESGCSCVSCVGKPHQNCEPCSSFLCVMKLNSFQLCQWTPAQVGWAGLGCAPAPLAPPAPSGASPPSGLQGVTQTVTLSGTGFVWGADVDMGPYVTVHGTNVINSTTMEVDITPATNAPLGLVDVEVTNRDLQSGMVAAAWEILQTKYHYASPTGITEAMASEASAA